MAFRGTKPWCLLAYKRPLALGAGGFWDGLRSDPRSGCAGGVCVKSTMSAVELGGEIDI